MQSGGPKLQEAVCPICKRAFRAISTKFESWGTFDLRPFNNNITEEALIALDNHMMIISNLKNKHINRCKMEKYRLRKYEFLMCWILTNVALGYIIVSIC